MGVQGIFPGACGVAGSYRISSPTPCPCMHPTPSPLTNLQVSFCADCLAILTQVLSDTVCRLNPMSLVL